MAKPTKAKTPAANLPVPQNDQEAVAAIAEIGAAHREIGRIQAGLNDDLAELQLTASAAVAPLQAKLDAALAGLQIYCQANRARLTEDGKTKTVQFATGKVAWRFRPAKVTLRGVEAIIASIKQLKLVQFLRVSEEVDKEAMLANPALARTVPGVSIGSAGEDFIVDPAEADIEEAVS